MNRARWICFAWLLSLSLPGNAATPMVAAGDYHSAALKSDGTVVTVGDDSLGQLGLGRSLQTSAPIQVLGLGQIRTVIAGRLDQVLAIRSDGTVLAWGNNTSGQLGDGTNTNRSSPVQVRGLTGVTAITAGQNNTVALTDDGTVWVFGSNGYATSTIPVQVLGLNGVTAIASGNIHTLALKQDGTVWAWGDNGSGELGDGTTTYRSVPVQVAGLTGVRAIGAGGNHSLAVKQDGTVWAWGWNLSGQLGDGTTVNRSTPVQVPGLTGVVAVAGGYSFSLALKMDGTVWGWGQDGGQGTASNPYLPVQAPGLTGVTAIAVGDWHIVALTQDGTVWTSGSNQYGQLGDGTTTGRSVSVRVSGLNGVTAITAGRNSTLVLKQDGTVWAWGFTADGLLADGASASRTTPATVPGLSAVTAIAAGNALTLALKQDGTVLGWGQDNTSIVHSTPTTVAGLANVAAIAAGFYDSIVLKNDGTVWGWGDNGQGQLGDGTNFFRSTPVQAIGLAGVIAIAAGETTLALKQDGTVWAWGNNCCGQLGDTSGTARNTPAPVPGLGNIIAIAVGVNHGLALKQDGTVWAWASNCCGQLGDGTFTSRATPVQVRGLTRVAAIAAGDSDSLALRQDGTMWAWGGNQYGQLGDGTTINRNTPVQIPGLTGVTSIAARNYTLAVKQDGSVLAWGRNFDGELGDGTLAQHLSPALVVNPSVDGFLNLIPGTVFEVPPSVGVPFFVVASGGITDTSASVNTTTKFNAADIGKSGAVFVTGIVPSGSLVPAQSPLSAFSAMRPVAFAASTPNSFVLIQLTSSGWQPVVNGQLIPYASGVLGDQVAAQTILNGIDTTNLKGAQFCLGYGVNADQMIAAGTMRVVATIPDPNATGAAAPSCIVPGSSVSYSLSLPQGWSLLGNSLNQALFVALLYGDPTSVISVWKWDAGALGWQFYTPLMDAATLQTYASSKGYGVLSTINPGDGYWVNAKASPTLSTQSGASFVLTSPNLANGWNLAATGIDVTPSTFNANLKASLPGTGVTTLWAWDNPSSRWYFYAPSLEAQGGTVLSDYIAGKGYLDFTSNNKTLGNGTGFWVNR
jgi:alpha-tubulin suppressor-like RCC1 family protein